KKAVIGPIDDELSLGYNTPFFNAPLEVFRPAGKRAGTGAFLGVGSGRKPARGFLKRRQSGLQERRVARIAGVNIPTQKRVVIALQYILGIGPKFAKDICAKVGIPAERRVSQLTDAEVLQIRETIDRDYMVEGDLRREVITNIKRLMDLGSY